MTIRARHLVSFIHIHLRRQDPPDWDWIEWYLDAMTEDAQ